MPRNFCFSKTTFFDYRRVILLSVIVGLLFHVWYLQVIRGELYSGKVHKYTEASDIIFLKFFSTTEPQNKWSHRDYCSIESALRNNLDVNRVIVGSNFITEPLRELNKSYTNRIIIFSPKYFVSNVLCKLEEFKEACIWYTLGGTYDGYRLNNLSNFFRILYLLHFGGLYLDTDIISLKPMKMSEAVGLEDKRTINNAVLKFRKGSLCLKSLLYEFIKNFDGSKWGHNGPKRITETFKKYDWCNATILDPIFFYPVHYSKISSIFSANKTAGVKKLEDSFFLHFNNKISKNFKVERDSVMWMLMKKNCPVTFNNMAYYY